MYSVCYPRAIRRANGDSWTEPGIPQPHLGRRLRQLDAVDLFDCDSTSAVDLRGVLDHEQHLVPGHTTDHLEPERLRELVEDHWSIVEVGRV
ncbi:hypothetical protein ASG84_25215 [Rhodococcus sp. Leaf278]|nr:hypothetical protein ASG84_25215 [Rhodococcus sp. Leaf278]